MRFAIVCCSKTHTTFVVFPLLLTVVFVCSVFSLLVIYFACLWVSQCAKYLHTRVHCRQLFRYIGTARTVCGTVYATTRCPSVCLPAPSAACSGFAAGRPASRRCWWTAVGCTALSSKCEQCHAYSRRRRLNTDRLPYWTQRHLESL